MNEQRKKKEEKARKTESIHIKAESKEAKRKIKLSTLDTGS